MANAICRASGCSDVVTRGQFTRYCSKHHRALYRHGHTHGNAFSKRELATYRKDVMAKRKATKDAPFWPQAEARWTALVNRAQSYISGVNKGQATHRLTRVAAESILKIARAAEVLEVMGGMYLALEQDPHRFVSDRHYWFQLARRVRSLGDTLTATRWDGRANNGTGKLRRLYHDLTPKGVEALAKWLVEALGNAGGNIARTINEDEKREREEAGCLSRELRQHPYTHHQRDHPTRNMTMAEMSPQDRYDLEKYRATERKRERERQIKAQAALGQSKAGSSGR
jgi:DNA-binding PadR family transcriptional regulator